MEPIRNKVAESEIEVFNLEELWDGAEIRQIDIAGFLAEGLVLKEKDFRARVKESDWSTYEGTHVAISCSTEAIVPTWAYMLLSSKLANVATSVALGTRDELVRDFFVRALERFDWERFRDVPVVVKGCASRLVPAIAYSIAMEKLQTVASKVMYGEPCSSVPIWRRPSAAGSGPSAVAKPVGVRLPSGES